MFIQLGEKLYNSLIFISHINRPGKCAQDMFFLVIFIGSPLALLVELGWSAISSDQTIETPRIRASK